MAENTAFRAVTRLAHFLDRFVPDSMREDAAERFRGRVSVAASWFAVLSGLLLVMMMLALDPRVMPARLLFFGILFWFASIPVLLRVTGYYQFLSTTLLVLVTVFILVVAYRNDGLEAPILTTLPIPVVLAFLLHGARRAVIVTAAILSCLAVMAWLGSTGQLPPPVIPEESRPLARRMALLISLGATSLLIGLYAGFHRMAQIALQEEIQTRIATEKELIVARNEAESAILLKANFLTAVTHEIRTPLTGVVGMAQLIAGKGLPVEEQEYLSALRLSADQLHDLINDILAFSKLSVGDVEEDIEEFNPGEMIGSVTQVMQDRADDGVHVRTRFEDISPRLAGEAQKFRQILVNIVSNAIKFTDNGEVLVTVTRELTDTDHCRLIVRVEDTGIGMNPDQIDHLFDEFRQGDEGLARRYGGIGLGLTISRKLLHQCGGNIDVVSSPGNGSVFTFSMPFQMMEHSRLSWESPESRHRDLLQGKSVLVVDDIALNRTLLVAMVRNLGCSDVDLADHGRAAVDAAKGKYYDAILMDIQMPEMDGVEATNHIRAIDGPIADTVIIAVTANALPGDRGRYMANGLSGYLAKPVKQAGFTAEMARHLS